MVDLFRILLIILSFSKFALAADPAFDRYLRTIREDEKISPAVKELLYEEQVLHNKSLWPDSAFDSNIRPGYIPENRPVFPLSYFLIPAEDALFLKTNGHDARVQSQISFVGQDGKRYFKMLIHPESYAHYKYLEGVYQYVGPDKTEFLASPTSSFRSLVVWNKDGRGRVFIAKVSLDKNVIGSIDRLVSSGEVERSVANQQAFESIGTSSLRSNNLDIFPETAGLLLQKSHPGAPEKLGGMLIREIPESIATGRSRWVSFSTLMSPNRRGKPMIMDVIANSGLTSEAFIERYLVTEYMHMFEEVSLKRGLNFEPHSQNLCFELTPDLKPTGQWVIRDFGGVWPDIYTMIKSGGPVEAYMQGRNAEKFKLHGGHSNAFSSYAFFYKRQVFDMILTEIAKHDRKLTGAKIVRLKQLIDGKMADMVARYLIPGERVVVTMENYKEQIQRRNAQTRFAPTAEMLRTSLGTEVKQFIEHKKMNGEWIQLTKASSSGSIFYADSKATYLIASEGHILGMGLHAPEDARRFAQSGNDMQRFLRIQVPGNSSGTMGAGGIGARCLTILRGLFAQ